SVFSQQESWQRDRAWSAHALDLDYTDSEVLESGSSRTPQGTIRIPQSPFGGPADGCLTNALCQALVNSVPMLTPGQRYIRDPDTPLGWRPFTNADFYNYAAANFLTIPSTRVQLFLGGDVKSSDNVRVYYEASYAHVRSEQNAAPMPLNPGD